MTHGVGDEPRGVPPSPIVIGALILAILGLVVSGPRSPAVILVLAVSGLGLVRYNVLGRPAVRLTAAGVSVGSVRFTWDEVGKVDRNRFPLRYLKVEVDRSVFGRLPWVDRLAMQFLRPPDKRWKLLWITEQQIGEHVDQALARVPNGHGSE